MSMPDIRTLLPQSGRMMLLDRVVAADSETLTSVVTVREDSQFFDGTGVGAWIGLEYMGQTVAAYAGYEALQLGLKVKPGFLLGTRRYTCNQPSFVLGVTLHVTARRELQGANGLASFVCTIVGDDVAADAAVTVFQPDNLEDYMVERGL